MTFDLSPEDTARWGVRTAKAFVTRRDEVPALIESCRRNEVRFAVVRCPAEETAAAQGLEREGMRLMDTLVFFSLHLRDWVAPTGPEGVTTRPMRAEEISVVRTIAEATFRGYPGHYHADERLDRAQCDAVYVDWSLKLCRSAGYPSEVLLAIVDDIPVGYMTFRWQLGEHGEAVLGGVTDIARRRGVYRALLVNGLIWLKAKGAETAMVSTQLSNVGVQKVWTRLGFEPHHALYTFHGWF